MTHPSKMTGSVSHRLEQLEHAMRENTTRVIRIETRLVRLIKALGHDSIVHHYEEPKDDET